MSRLTEAARGMPCMVRLGCCNGNQETTVLAHYRDLSLGAGTALKPPDWCGAWACSACHDACDSRSNRPPGISRETIRAAHAVGVLRTLKALIQRGEIDL